ncbi:hypothetical protein GMD78_13100 [Ornithinibacillus sp. L9]|uniref:Uncharacterized protein n=1 Tax=Ornithinibacillus caprae TaxID=2678566 RepID=A0A6N8FNF0_9BACI|nr:hypothetical protein [Ornithinibacillus caprae]MUK89309.1 hypothetical protein [Ornithinibacillus caprae]
MNKYLDLEFILNSEIETLRNTNNNLNGVVTNTPKVINTLVKLPYYTGELESVDKTYGAFQGYCKEHYLQSPYTFLSIYESWKKGYYLESVILYRHLLEVYVQMRYFEKNHKRLEGYLTGTDRIRMVNMFDEFSQGFYHDFYGRQLSTITHGKIGKSLFRIIRTSPEKGRVIMGCEYNEFLASYVMNIYVPLIFGYINFFNIFFPNNTLDGDILIEIKESKDWLEMFMNEHKKAYPKSIEPFYRHFDKYIYS